MQQAMRNGKVPYYESCELNVYPAKQDDSRPKTSTSVFLTLKSGLEPSKEYR